MTSLPRILVLMGVSGSGKTTVGAMLAGRLRWRFAEADEFHSPANVAKMRAGTPLTDADRLPWLRAIAAQIDQWRSAGVHGVVTCSALKRAYRDILIGDRPDVRLVHLKGEHTLIADRMAARQGHFMPASLLDSQFATLEDPAPEENAISIWIGKPPELLVEDIVAALGAD